MRETPQDWSKQCKTWRAKWNSRIGEDQAEKRLEICQENVEDKLEVNKGNIWAMSDGHEDVGTYHNHNIGRRRWARPREDEGQSGEDEGQIKTGQKQMPAETKTDQ